MCRGSIYVKALSRRGSPQPQTAGGSVGEHTPIQLLVSCVVSTNIKILGASLIFVLR
jgi:hypothetical protein